MCDGKGRLPLKPIVVCLVVCLNDIDKNSISLYNDSLGKLSRFLGDCNTPQMGEVTMGKDRRRERVARSVGLALTAGMFSIVPTAFGAPIQDTSVATTAAIAQGASAATGAGIDTKITSTVQNNVIGWKDFSVKKDEKVEFDGKNYLNLVTGANTSEINGIVTGGGDVYVVNPNGIIFGKDAQVNVGNLYASTRYVDRAAAETARAAGDIHSVLATTSAGVAADVVNLGKISATKVEVEGANIRFVSDNVSATGANVTLKADGANGGYIHVGNAAAASPSYTMQNLDGSTAATSVTDNYQTVDGSNWTTKFAANSSGNFMLVEDIDATTATGFAPVASFSGKFDGMFHKVRNMTSTTGGGLFRTTANATIQNVGIVDATITGVSAASPGGALIGHATGVTTVDHVYSDGTTSVSGDQARAGALIGSAGASTNDKTNISYSYTTCANEAASKAMIGNLMGKGLVDHSYVIANYPAGSTVNYGFARAVLGSGAELKVQNSYFSTPLSTADSTMSGATAPTPPVVDSIIIRKYAAAKLYNHAGAATDIPTVTQDDVQSIRMYNTLQSTVPGVSNIGWLGDISDTGGVHIDTATGKVTRPSWRIYEGRALPILTSMTRGIKTVDYRYAYYKKGTGGTYTEQDTAATRYNGGKNGGKDIPASGTNPADGLLYNARFLKIVDEDGKELQDATSTAGGVAADGNIAQNKAIAFSGDRGTHIFYGQDEGKYGQLHATYDGAQQSRALLWSDQAGYDLVGGNISIAPRTVSVPQKDLKEVVFKKEYDGTANVDASKIAALYEGTSTNVHGILDEDKAAGLVVNTSGIAGKYVNPDTTKAQSAAEDWDRPTSYTNADDKQDVGAKKYVHLGGTLTLTSNGSAYTGHDYVINPADAAIDTFAKGLIYQRTLALSTLPAASQKIYDGTADVMTAGNGFSTDTARNFTTADFSMDRTNVHGADDVALSVSGKAKYVDKQTDGTYQETKKVGTHDIEYTGIKLTGVTAGNYTLVYGSEAIYSKKGRLTKDSNWNAAVAPVPSDASTGGTGVLHQAGGKITPRTISRTDYAWYKNVSGVLTEQDATRQYNGHTSYTDPVGPTDGRTVRLSSTATPTALGLVGTDDIQFTAAAADFTTAQGTGSPLTKNVYNAALGATDGAQAVRYKVTVTGSDAENYAFLDAPTVALKTDGTQYDVYGKGTITPRELKVKAGAAKAVKPYDGDAKVKRGGTGTENLEFGTDDYIVYDDDPAKTEAENERYHLVAGDTDKIAYTGIYKQTGTEAAKDVNWDAANHVVLDKDVTYTVTVKNGASPSANYTFVGAASAAPNQVSLDVAKGGRIEQRELTGFRMGDVEKFYDTTAELNGGTDNIVSGKNTNTVDRALKDATATGLVGTDKIWDVFDASKIQGAYGRTAAGTFTENEHVNRDAAQNVIKTAVRYAGTNGAASLADAMTDHNYTLAAGTLQDDGSFVQEKGGKIKPVTLQHVTVTADRATKVYDGNQNVIAPAGHESEGAAYFLTHHTGTDAGKLHAMTGTSNGHTVLVDYRVVSGAYASKDSHNGALQNVTYKLKAIEDGDYTLDASLKDASGNYSYTAVNGGTITPKTVYASARRDPLTKVYDAKRAAGVAGDAAVTLEGLIDGTNASTAAYDDKNVGTGKTVTYEVKLDPATQALGNYYIVDRSYTGNDPANHRITQLQTMDNAITPASLTVTFGTPTKEYDGNTNIQNPAQINAQITGLLTDDSGVQDQVTLNPALLSQAKYNDANVGTGKPIDYTLELQGADAGNYTIQTATQKENPTTHAQEWHQTGYGVITKKRVAPGGNPFSVTLAPITKVYDGTDAVAYDHTGWQYGQGGAGAKKTAGDYVNAFTLAGIPLQAANGDYSITSAKYDSPNVGASSAEYTFKISDTIAKNYDFSALSPGVFDNGVYHYTASGASITPQRVVMTLTALETTKVYNGLRDVVTNAQTNVTGTPVDLTPLVAVSKADQKHDLALTAGDLSAQYASKDVQFDGAGNVALQNVTYKVNLQTNPQNYELYVDATAATSGAGGTIGAIDLIGKGKILQKEIRTITFGDEVEKTYDGTARVTENASGTEPKDTISQAASTAQSADFVNGETFGQIFDATKLKGYYGTGTNAANFQQDANVLREGGAVSKKTMQYMGMAAGADADIATAITNRNYKMADGVTSIVQEKAGKIKPKQMNFDDAVKVDFGAIQKVYDGSTDVSYNHSAWNRQDTGRMDAKDYIHSVRIGPSAASMTTLEPDKYAAKAAYDSADAGARTAHYTITIAPAAAQMFNNYELTTAPSSGVSYDPATHAIKMAHAGQITPQEVVAKAERAATKVYDGTTNLVKGSTQAAPAGTGAIQPLADGYVALRRADGRTRNPDGSSVWGTASPTVTGHYDTKDVVLNPDGTVGEKTVSYTASAGNNYKLIDAASPSNTAIGTLSFTGKGRIEQKQIEVKFGRMEKEYDGSADATPANLSDAIPTTPPIGAVNGDAFDDIFDRSRIKGYYGDVYENGTLVPDASVRRDANHHVIDKVTAFTDSATDNIADALKRNPNGVSNYALAGNPKAIAGVGKIAPHAIHTSDVRVHYDPISRAYDGTRYGITNSDFSENQDAERGHLKLTTTINGASVDLQYDLGQATFDDANVGTNKTVTYHMNGLAEQDLGNYAVESGFGAWLNNPANWQFAGNTITPRKIAHLTKTYDGTNYVSPIDPATHAPILDTATHLPLAIEPARTKDGGDYETATQFSGILAGDAGMVRTVITNAAYDDSKAGSRTVNYTAEILGDTHGNYAFADAAATTPHTISYQGAGEIQKRKLTIRGNVLGLDRAYDQTEHVDAAGRTRIEDVLDDPANWSGLVTVNGATDDVRLKTDPSTGDASFDAYYVRANDRTPDRHVRRDADGTVQEKNIVVDNIQVEGNDAGNYELSSEIRASGKITPKVLTSAVTDPAEKVYDGTSALRNPQAKIHVEGAVMMPTGRPEDVGLQVEGTFAHADASGQITNADARNVDDANRALYHISIANGDYALDPSYAMQEDLSGAGRITPYTLKATARTATKTYDGDTALRADGDGAVLPQDGAGYYLDVDKPAFDDAALGVTATSAGYGNKDAGSYAILYENLALTNNAHGNYALEADLATGLPKAVQGKGVIEKRKLSLTDVDPVSKVYDGTDTLLSYDRNTNRNETVTAKDKFHIRGLRNVVPGEENDVFEDIAITGKFASRHAGNQGVQYDLHLAARSAKNYDLPETYTGAGTITPRTIGVQADPTKTPQKVYDAGRDLPDAQAYLVAANGADPINKILAGDRVGVASAKGTFRDPNVAGTPGANRVDYTHIALDNPDYQLANDALPDQPGTITRRPLRVKAKPQIRVLGEDLTGFAPGTVSGWATPADKEALEGAFEWGPAPGAKQPVVPGLYGLYGTYHGQLEGDFDRNYTFDQEPANRTALMIGPNRAYYAATADGLLRPDRTVYTQASKDRTSDYARVPKYDVSYTAGGAGNGRTTEPIARDTTVEHERGEQHPIFARKTAFGIEGEDAVNLDGGDRATRDQAEASLAR